jgi:hypothetical protein
MRKALVAILTLSACFEPDTSKIILLCDESNPCPTDQSCVEGRCQSVPLDMASADATDLISESGCAAGIVGKKAGAAFACPGQFTVGNARNQCAANWVVCNDGLKVDLVECNKFSGFFVGDKPGYDGGSPNLAVCAPDPGMGNRDWFGCGTRATHVFTANNPCGNFTKVLSCQPASNWNCFAGTTLDKTANSNNGDGVLCCKS